MAWFPIGSANLGQQNFDNRAASGFRLYAGYDYDTNGGASTVP